MRIPSSRPASGPALDSLVGYMRPPEDLRVRLDGFPKGIDNAHIDVRLGQRFVLRATNLVRRMLSHEVSVNLWGERPPEPSSDDLQFFLDAYVGMTEVAVERAHETGRPDIIPLFQLAVTKFLLQLVVEELRLLRSRLQKARDQDPAGLKVSPVQIHERLVSLARDQQLIRYKLTRELFRQVHKLESTRLRKLRKAVMGQSWPLSRNLVMNPMLLLPGLSADEQVMLQYNLVMTDKDPRSGFAQINRLVTGLLEGMLPDWVRAPEAREAVTSLVGRSTGLVTFRHRTDQGSLGGFLEVELLLSRSISDEEYAHDAVSWLDVPKNLGLLLAVDQSATDPGRLPPQWTAFSRRLLRHLGWRLWRTGLMRRVLASYEVGAVYADLQARLPAGIIYEYLGGLISRRKLKRRLASSQIPVRPEEVLPTLDRTRARLRRLPHGRRLQRLARFALDFAVFRRDLKCAYVAYRAMDRIRLLSRSEDIALSKANGKLQSFADKDKGMSAKTQARNHVIIKADVRGSTGITAQLLERDLNAATHFSLNFFDPISRLLDDFGAQKVFVEGDAVILSLLESNDTSLRWLSVAQACGLARKMLAVVDAQNAQNRRHDLPELEIGLGITYADGPPTYLYDGDHQIMISSAINRADRLSSCSSSLRKAGFFANRVGRGVEVVSVPLGHGDKAGGEGLLRYNVNGCELEMAAFVKLKRELVLRKVDLVLAGEAFPSRFHVGRYPDRRGLTQWLVVREAAVRIWRDGSLRGADPQRRRFFEVMTEPSLIARVKQQVGSRRASRVPIQPPNPPDSAS